MVEKRTRCPTCGKPEGYLLTVNKDQPGFGGLLRGEGKDPPLNRVAWLALLLIVFGVAVAAFSL